MGLGLGGDTLAFTQVLAISQYITLTHPGYACAIITKTIIRVIHNAVLPFINQFSLNVPTFESLIPFHNLYITSIVTVYLHYKSSFTKIITVRARIITTQLTRIINIHTIPTLSVTLNQNFI
jgi:hypothetical protein